MGPLSETETDSEDDEAFLPVAASQVFQNMQRHVHQKTIYTGC